MPSMFVGRLVQIRTPDSQCGEYVHSLHTYVYGIHSAALNLKMLSGDDDDANAQTMLWLDLEDNVSKKSLSIKPVLGT